jgi:hypothetical protein
VDTLANLLAAIKIKQPARFFYNFFGKNAGKI